MDDQAHELLADEAMSLEEFKVRADRIVADQDAYPVALLNGGVVAAYVLTAKRYDELLEYISDLKLTITAMERMQDPVLVPADDLLR